MPVLSNEHNCWRYPAFVIAHGCSFRSDVRRDLAVEQVGITPGVDYTCGSASWSSAWGRGADNIIPGVVRRSELTGACSSSPTRSQQRSRSRTVRFSQVRRYRRLELPKEAAGGTLCPSRGNVRTVRPGRLPQLARACNAAQAEGRGTDSFAVRTRQGSRSETRSEPSDSENPPKLPHQWRGSRITIALGRLQRH